MLNLAKAVIYAEDRTVPATESARRNLSKVSDSAELLNSTLRKLGGLLTFSAFAAMVKGAIDAADELGKMSQKTGIATEELSKLKYAAGLSDVSTEALAKGLKGLSQRMTEAVDGTSKAGQIMKALGVDINAGASPALDRIADVFGR